MARILLTGNITLDIINEVDHFPAEDEEVRALEQRVNAGGNAANSARVLAQLGQRAHFCGSVANDSSGDRLLRLLAEERVNSDACSRADGRCPTSYITLNRQNGSRTIVHHRQLAELDARHFTELELEVFDWFHFEGRNVAQLEQMLQELIKRRIDQPISLELEKPRDGLEALARYADVLMFSRAYAEATGFDSAEAFLRQLHRQYPQQQIALGWGAAGAYGIDNQGRFFHEPAQAPLHIIDSIGAGDTFVAGLINALCSGNPLPQSLAQACRLAEKKLACHGFSLRQFR